MPTAHPRKEGKSGVKKDESGAGAVGHNESFDNKMYEIPYEKHEVTETEKFLRDKKERQAKAREQEVRMERDRLQREQEQLKQNQDKNAALEKADYTYDSTG
jgi:hypothetical protein